jgi:hypothetical protein
MIPAAAQGKLSYRRLSISFPDAYCIDWPDVPDLLQEEDQLS